MHADEVARSNFTKADIDAPASLARNRSRKRAGTSSRRWWQAALVAAALVSTPAPELVSHAKAASFSLEGAKPGAAVTVKRGGNFAVGAHDIAGDQLARVIVRLCPLATGCAPGAGGREAPALATSAVGRAGAEGTVTATIPAGQDVGIYTVHVVANGADSTAGRVRVIEASSTLFDHALSPRAARWWAIGAGLAAVGLSLVALVLVLRTGGSRTLVLQSGYRVRPLSALFIDRSSSSYSLTALQFHVWTLTAVGVYAYVWSLRYLVWGDAGLPELANGLLYALGIGTGTGVLSSAISTLGGGKGNGDFHPSYADYVTSGGVVAPERVQQLLWLWIGALGYAATTVGSDPAELVEAPDLPNSVLALAGLSSVGFLGGKLGRGPGPVITGVVAKATPGQAGPPAVAGELRLEVSGSSLSPTATFMLAKERVPAGLGPAAPPPPPVPGAAAPAGSVRIFDTPVPVSVTVVGATVPSGSTLATQLTVSIADQKSFSFASRQSLSLTLVNPDGERSVWEFRT